MSLLSFNWDKHFIYAIIYWILEICVRLVMYLKWEEYFKVSDSDIQNEYVYVILLTIADLLAGFLVLYIKLTFKRRNKPRKSIAGIELIFDNIKESKRKNIIQRMIIICSLNYLSRSLYWISYAITGANNDEVSHQRKKM